MNSELDINDVAEKKHSRDESGDLVAESETIHWNGEMKTVKVRPVTTGVINRLAAKEQEITRLEPAAVLEVLQTLYKQPDFSGWTAADIKDLDGQALDSLMQPFEEAINEELGEGN